MDCSPHLLRKIVDNVRGESQKRHWFVFDGDVDPEWVENMNSLLDDNKLLTLPNGERLALPPNVRVLFEVQDLRYATLATVSRCGMVWFSENVVTPQLVLFHYLETLRAVPLDEAMESGVSNTIAAGDTALSPALVVQRECAGVLAPHFEVDGVVIKSLLYASELREAHIMEFGLQRALASLFSLINKSVRTVLDYNMQHTDFPMTGEALERYISKRLLFSMLWAFVGDARLDARAQFGEFLRQNTAIPVPSSANLLDYEVLLSSGEWSPWHNKVPSIDIETHKVIDADVVVPTIDTVRHEDLLYAWLAEHKPIVLCGPPGSGKTMTLFSALRKLPDMEVVGLNFSSATAPELVLKTFEHYCEYKKSAHGLILSPKLVGKWLVVFCDEINLPANDKYGTQRVISFLRQMIEQNGFWRASDQNWVTLERIQFVGACNPPTDPGRTPLSARFLRHAPVVLVDYPGKVSLLQIYGTFSRALLKLIPSLRTYSEALTEAMVEVYASSQARFTPDIQAHYIYSPRELTRWVRGIYEALKPLDSLSNEGLVRLWAHEALRLFQDRLVLPEEKQWTEEQVDAIAQKHFKNVDVAVALKRPILYSNWMSKQYTSVDREGLREFVRARLKVFHEEELDVPLVLFDDVLDHVLRIDRVLRQIQGHLLLIGVSGSGKTTLSRFVAWINGLAVFQIKVHNRYTASDFDDDLRTVLRRCSIKGEKICFILDESNMLESGFLERMNTLLANGEVPGLFEGDELASLLTQLKDASQRDGAALDTPDELYKWFTGQVMRNLHVIFTMNPPEKGDLQDRAATSPALFNRCVLDWFGDWSEQAFFQVGKEFTDRLDLDLASYRAPEVFPVVYADLPLPPSHRLAIANAFVFAHKSMRETTSRLAKREGRQTYVTPRHYLDFIAQYVTLFQEKRRDLEDEQLHVNIGLSKLKETVAKVAELSKSLAAKNAQLEEKNTQANDKLKVMLHDQQEAERKRAISIEIQAKLEEQTKYIEERRTIVVADLAKAEPAVLEAQQSVQDIKKQQLVEVRSMANPPSAVKVTLEAVCMMLGEKYDSWKSVQAVIRRDDFIASIVNFRSEALKQELRERLKSEYLNDPNFNFEAVNRASKACGPLALWVIAQVSYADILERVEPLRLEVQKIEVLADESRAKAAEIDRTIGELERSIATYKEEYAVLISETQRIKSEMEVVSGKVSRSTALIKSLSSENERWQTSSEAFQTQMATLPGDVFLSAGFLAYAGYFDQSYRKALFTRWCEHLQQAGLGFKPTLRIAEYLSTADDRLSWHQNALPVDDLCVENAIMLRRFNRFPLIIDPSGQAAAFLMNQFRERKITKTSFLDDSFLKNLESSIRFGNPLLIQDVENFDPILNPVLNRELRRAGGRVLIQLGSQEIDFSPSFTLFLTTRDPTTHFRPDICSRVTFVNFTVTRSSLESQCLHLALKAERPDVEQKRVDLIKLQGEYQQRLRQLEKALLQALNESKGNILDDDHVIATLEKLKQEAADVSRKSADTEQVMAQVEEATLVYRPLAHNCSAIYFILEQMSQIHPYYQFSLDLFNDIFRFVVHQNPRLAGVSDLDQRLSILTDDMFAVAFKRVAWALRNDDRLVFAVLLAQVRLTDSPQQLDPAELEFFLSGSADAVLRVAGEGGKAQRGSAVTSTPQRRQSALPTAVQKLLEPLLADTQLKARLQEHIAPEQEISRLLQAKDSMSSRSVQHAFHTLLLVKHLRPDRLLPAVVLFVQIVFGVDFLHQNAEPNLQQLMEQEIAPATPIALCSMPGYDAAFRVDQLAGRTRTPLLSIAIGSIEGYAQAERAIASSSKTGGWTLLKNVHLAPQWLAQLEKRLHSLHVHPGFRLFMTMEVNPKVPANLLRLSRVFLFEAPAGIKASLLQAFQAVSTSVASGATPGSVQRASRPPAERARLYFLTAWLSAVLQERRRYVPLGWSKPYDFNDADQQCALDLIDTWLDASAGGRSNIAPERIPWDALQRLLIESVYGGKMDNDFDLRLLGSLVGHLFVPQSFDVKHELVPGARSNGGSDAVLVPDAVRFEDFQAWIEALPDREPPSWLGLPDQAEDVLLMLQGNAFLAKVRKLRLIDDSDDDASRVRRESLSAGGGRPGWLVALQASLEGWLADLPEQVTAMLRSSDSLKDPLFRCFERENVLGQRLLALIRSQLQSVQQFCLGQTRLTNQLRALVKDLSRGIVPAQWMPYKAPPEPAFGAWLNDFIRRIEQLNSIATCSAFQQTRVWLGGLFMPESWVTASRQFAARRHGWSLEELELSVTVEESDRAASAGNYNAFVVTEMLLLGASWDKPSEFELRDATLSRLPALQFEWLRREGAATQAVDDSKDRQTILPVYLNDTRADLLFTMQVPTKVATVGDCYQRGVAFICSDLKGAQVRDRLAE